MLAVTPLRQLIGFLPVVAVVLLAGAGNLDGRLYGVLAAVVAVVLAGVARWFTTRYRVADERVELRSGLVFRSSRSVPRDRIRTVDLTAGPVHRVFGLSVLKVGTGQRTEGTVQGELALDAVSATEADGLRRRLLERAGEIAPAPVAAPVDQPIARLDWAWLRYAPLTVSSLVAVGAVAGAGAQLAGELGVDPSEIPALDEAGARLDAAPLWLGVPVLAVLVLAVALLGSVLLFVEAWWGFRLAREPGGTLRVRRGLLTTRSVSLEEARVRGVEVVEPLLLRAGRGARLTAVATGLGGTAQGEGRGTLLPPAPRAVAHRVGAAVLDAPQPPTGDPPRPPTGAALRAHPRAALRRRLVRAVLPVLVVSGVLALVNPVPGWIPLAVLGALPVTLALAVDAYRNLGHALAGGYLVTRHGAAIRRTVALQRSGVIGWTVSQTFFQRRAGLATVAATTAAGSGAYQVIDVGIADGLALADRAVPDLLRFALVPSSPPEG
jgi:putative membrane protein